MSIWPWVFFGLVSFGLLGLLVWLHGGLVWPGLLVLAWVNEGWAHAIAWQARKSRAIWDWVEKKAEERLGRERGAT